MNTTVKLDWLKPKTGLSWLILIIYLLYIVGYFMLIDSQSHSVSDTLINFVPCALLATGLYVWLINRLNKKSS